MTATMTAMTRMMETYPQCEFPSCMRRASVWRRFSGEREGVRVEGRWYCSPECFEKAAVDIYARLLPSARRRDAKRHRIPLGLVLFPKAWSPRAICKPRCNRSASPAAGWVSGCGSTVR